MWRNKRRSKKGDKNLGLVILIILAKIGAIISLMHFRFNPAVPLAHSMQSGASEHYSAPDIQAANPLVSLPKGIVSLTPPEVFDPQNLYEKIDGAAELYLSSGFVTLQCQRFTEVAYPDTLIEIFLYNMGNIMNAFAIFSSQRRSEDKPIDIAQFSNTINGAIFFVHGPYYVQIIASMTREKTNEAIQEIAKNFINENKIDVNSISEVELFPRRNLDENSISLIISNAFSFNQLDLVFTAAYKLRGAGVTAFLSHRKTPEEATQLAQGYYEFLLAYGGKGREPGLLIEDAKMVEIVDTYELFFARGSFLAGVREALSAEQAEDLANMLDQELGEAAGEK
jgi:hypothetical protein